MSPAHAAPASAAHPAPAARRRLLFVLLAFGATALLAAMLTLYLFAD
jgi:hypothetical protein